MSEAGKQLLKNPELFRGETSDGRTLNRGEQYRLKGRKGPYVFLYTYPNGDLTFWGPVNSQQAQFTTVKNDGVAPTRVRAVRRVRQEG